MRPCRLPILMLLATLLGANARVRAEEPPPLTVTALNYPLSYFAERVGGHQAQVKLPVPAGQDPAQWRPDPAAVRDMQKSDLILLNGAGAEPWLTQVSLPRLKLVDTSAGFRSRYIQMEGLVTHSHGPGGTHTHSATANLTWLDLQQAALQADAVAKAMSLTRPAASAAFAGRLAALQADLNELDAALASLSKTRPQQPLLGSHPVYQYLARRYELNLRSVHWEPGQPPGEAEWKALEQLLRAHPARWMLWEAQPEPETAMRLEKLGVRSIAFDTCDNRRAEGDFVTVMRGNLQRLKAAFP
ncbi:MAG: metal ABC transporter substrate-binding protein [Methylotetracoccus sp.]